MSDHTTIEWATLGLDRGASWNPVRARNAHAMLRRTGRLGEDAGGLDARFVAGQRLVVFSRDGDFVAAWHIADRVMAFDPHAPARCEDDA